MHIPDAGDLTVAAWSGMEAGLHLPQVDLAGDGLTYGRLAGAVDAARECGFVAVSANDPLFFGVPWLDGPSALAAVVEHAGHMTLATTVSLPTLSGPVCSWPKPWAFRGRILPSIPFEAP